MPHLLKPLQWNTLYVFGEWLEASFEKIVHFLRSFEENTAEWEDYINSESILDLRVPRGFHSHLSPFLIMVLQKIFRPDKLLFAISDYVKR